MANRIYVHRDLGQIPGLPNLPEMMKRQEAREDAHLFWTRVTSITLIAGTVATVYLAVRRARRTR